MRVKMKKRGNSALVRIPATAMQSAHLELDQDVEIGEEDGRVIVQPLDSPGYNLDALLDDITIDNLHREVATGLTAGNEIW